MLQSYPIPATLSLGCNVYIYTDIHKCVSKRVGIGGFGASAFDRTKTLNKRDEHENLLISVEAWSLQR